MKSLALALALALAGCARPKPGDIPSVRYGVDACARCGMTLSEERFASGYVDAQGRSIVFDDVGELIAQLRAEPALSEIAYVHDAQDGRWVRASEAFIIHVPGLATPMGTGYAAFAGEDQARSFARRLRKRAALSRLSALLAP